ncbi:MAG: nucleotidyltransferase domain-containing protein [Saprospiraceae bacterium]
MEELIDKYSYASKTYIDQEIMNEEVIGIIVSGSLKYGKIDKNSDIDIHIILDENCHYRERGNLWIKGIEIEYFKNPPAQILAYFEKEKKSPHTAHMLAFGEIVYNRSLIVDELVSIAKSIIEEKPPKLKDFEVEFEKYFLDDFYKDFEDAVANRDIIGSKIIRAKFINRSLDIFFNIHQIRREKDKSISNQLVLIAPDFRQHIVDALSEDWQKSASLERLRLEVEKLLGGRRTPEWKLRSKLDL